VGAAATRIVPRRSATCASWRHSFAAVNVPNVRRNLLPERASNT